MDKSAHLTRGTLIRTLGELDELLAVEFMATGATVAELRSAMRRLDADDEAPHDRERRLIAIRNLLELVAEIDAQLDDGGAP